MKPIIFIGMETSGQLRRRFQFRGYETYSADLLPSKDGGEEMAYSEDNRPLGRHLVGDVFQTLDNMYANDMWPFAAVFHPTCTNLTTSAEWAYKDPDFVRYPSAGYHQKLKPGTLFGKARREAREAALDEFRRLMHIKIPIKVFENPRGVVGTRIRKASQTVQPYELGDDASKTTDLWFVDDQANPIQDMQIVKEPWMRVPGRIVEWPKGSGKMVERWSNQTDSNQNKLGQTDDRWDIRSRTYDGIADAIVDAVIAQINKIDS